MPEENSEKFSTQGTVQVEVACGEGGDAKIYINPTPGYSVKHGKDDYVVFVPEPSETDAGAKKPHQVLDALILKRDNHLTMPKSQLQKSQSQPDLMKMVTEAAIQGVKIQITIKKVEESPAEIVSFRIPAPLSSDSL